MTQTVRKPLKKYEGLVSRRSGDKTIRVVLEYQTKHPKYGKILRRRTIANVHDEANAAKPGDKVEICECRPLSRTKRWRLLRVVNTAV
jgi:small subunit ribosomal protein S17